LEYFRAEAIPAKFSPVFRYLPVQGDPSQVKKHTRESKQSWIQYLTCWSTVQLFHVSALHRFPTNTLENIL